MRAADSKLFRDQVVFGSDLVLAVEPFEPPDGEMAPRDVLEMIDECIVDCGAAESADDWKGLCCNLLRDNESEARRNLGDELQKDGRSLFDDAAFGDEPGGFRHRLCEHAANGVGSRETATSASGDKVGRGRPNPAWQ
jgi:hypothetical protein